MGAFIDRQHCPGVIDASGYVTYLLERYGIGATVRPSTQRTNELLRERIARFTELLIGKNAKYDNAALEPMRLMSQAHPLETIKVRIDDKLKRLQHWFSDPANAMTVETVFQNEDTISDLIGYLFLLQVGAELQAERYGVDEAQMVPTKVAHRLIESEMGIAGAAPVDTDTHLRNLATEITMRFEPSDIEKIISGVVAEFNKPPKSIMRTAPARRKKTSNGRKKTTARRRRT